MTTARETKHLKAAIVVADWQDCVRTALIASGLNETLAGELAEDAVRAIVDNYAGQQIYIPTGLRQRITAEHQAIYADYLAGMSRADIATKHDKSMTWIYVIIRSIEAEMIRTGQAKNVQLDMFGEKP